MAVMLIEWVCTAAFLIVVVLALRAALGRRMSAGLRYALWAVVLVRMLVPVQLFTSPIAGTRVFSETRTGQTIYTAPNPPAAPVGPGEALSLGGQDGPSGTLSNFPQAPNPPALPDAPEPPAAPDLTKAPVWLGWAWLVGSAAVTFVLLLSNLRFFWVLRRERILLEAADCPLRVYVAVGLPSPCLFGLIRPAVYVTPEAAANPAMLRHVLAHEYTHYRHGDHLWSLLRCAALAAHWWNPLAWLAAVLSQRDGELACDEGALRRLGDGERAGYGSTLLALVTAKPRPGDLFRCATTMAGDKKSLRERISRIAFAPKRVIWAVVVAVLVTALACACAFGQAAEEPDPEPSETPDAGEADESWRNLDFTGGELVFDLNWENRPEYVNVELPEYPGVVFECRMGGVTAVTEDGEQPLYSGMPVWDLYLCDLTGDGRRELCSRVSFGSGMIDDRIRVYDYAEQTLYELENRGVYDYILRPEVQEEKRWLWAEEWEYTSGPREDGGEPRRAGLLVLTAHGLDIREEPENWNDIPAHFTMDVSKVPGDVARFIGEDAWESCSSLRLYWGNNEVSGPVLFDDWRVNSLNGPWTGTVRDMDLEVWRFNYEAHTTTPEKAAKHIDGDAYLTEDGWLRNFAKDSSYAVFVVNGDGTRSPLITGLTGFNDPAGLDKDPDAFFKWLSGVLERRGMTHPADFPQTDLNRNGVPETLQVYMTDWGSGQRLDIREEGKVISSAEGYYAHVGYNAMFLCTLNGEDYLLCYNPYMGQGWCGYSYKLFTLEGQETIVRENGVEFDINFWPLMHESFEPEAIAAFMDDVNGLLAHSVQLFNTDEELLSTFERNGRLYDDLGWLDGWEPAFVRDGSKSLADNLRAYQEAMEAQWYAETPEVFPIDELGKDIRLSYKNKATRFQSPGWDYGCQPAELVEPPVVDLDGDGQEEIVVILVGGHGTGAMEQNLYVFDADTLEQYDTGGLNDMILNSVQSTGDEENFYLSCPGMDRVTILKSEAQEKNGAAPVAEALGLGEVIEYSVEDGRVYCDLGCEASGVSLNYIGTLRVALEFSPSGGFRCVGGRYTSFGA